MRPFWRHCGYGRPDWPRGVEGRKRRAHKAAKPQEGCDGLYLLPRPRRERARQRPLLVQGAAEAFDRSGLVNSRPTFREFVDAINLEGSILKRGGNSYLLPSSSYASSSQASQRGGGGGSQEAGEPVVMYRPCVIQGKLGKCSLRRHRNERFPILRV